MASKIKVSALAPEVESMLQNDGVYFASDSRVPSAMIPMVSMKGKIYVLQMGKELDPFRFLPTMILSGPFLPPTKTENERQPEQLPETKS